MIRNKTAKYRKFSFIEGENTEESKLLFVEELIKYGVLETIERTDELGNEYKETFGVFEIENE